MNVNAGSDLTPWSAYWSSIIFPESSWNGTDDLYSSAEQMISGSVARSLSDNKPRRAAIFAINISNHLYL